MNFFCFISVKEKRDIDKCKFNNWKEGSKQSWMWEMQWRGRRYSTYWAGCSATWGGEEEEEAEVEDEEEEEVEAEEEEGEEAEEEEDEEEIDEEEEDE